VNGVVILGQIACIPQGYTAKSMFDETGNLAHYSGNLGPVSGRYVTVKCHIYNVLPAGRTGVLEQPV
jgi:hypothetical protein